MGRPRRQEPRRAQLIAATHRVLARDGLVGLRVREVAAEAGMSPASVLYYFPDSYQIAVQAMDHAVHAWATERAAVAASVPDPARRLVTLVLMEIPDPMPGIRRAFCEIPGQVKDHPELAALVASLVEDQVAVIRAAIEDGVGSGAFPPGVDPEFVARGVVAILHAVTIYLVCGLETADQARARAIAHLESALGIALPTPSPVVGEHPVPPAVAAPPASPPSAASTPSTKSPTSAPSSSDVVDVRH